MRWLSNWTPFWQGSCSIWEKDDWTWDWPLTQISGKSGKSGAEDGRECRQKTQIRVRSWARCNLGAFVAWRSGLNQSLEILVFYVSLIWTRPPHGVETKARLSRCMEKKTTWIRERLGWSKRGREGGSGCLWEKLKLATKAWVILHSLYSLIKSTPSWKLPPPTFIDASAPYLIRGLSFICGAGIFMLYDAAWLLTLMKPMTRSCTPKALTTIS